MRLRGLGGGWAPGGTGGCQRSWALPAAAMRLPAQRPRLHLGFGRAAVVLGVSQSVRHAASSVIRQHHVCHQRGQPTGSGSLAGRWGMMTWQRSLQAIAAS